jgi:hypothetical protein
MKLAAYRLGDDLRRHGFLDPAFRAFLVDYAIPASEGVVEVEQMDAYHRQSLLFADVASGSAVMDRSQVKMLQGKSMTFSDITTHPPFLVIWTSLR